MLDGDACDHPLLLAGERAMLYVALVVSAILLLVVNLIAWKAKRPVGMIVAKSLAIGLAATGVCLVMLPPVLLQAVLVCIAALIWRARRRGPQYFLTLSCAATVVAFAIPGYFAFQQTRHLQQAYPYISIDERLPLTKKQQSGETLPTATANRLSELESSIDQEGSKRFGDRRRELLRALHEETVQIFVNQPGFGVSRAGGLREYVLRMGFRQQSPIPQPGTFSPSPWTSPPLQRQQTASDSLLSLHQASVVDFVNPVGFGYIKDRRHVAGFQDLRISQAPTPDRPWTLQTLDLIGLVLHEKPTAYVSEYLPRMEELRAAPTRDLDDFESAGLLALQRGEDLFFRERENERRMLGAIRAARQCLACHEVERGDLLGAFSYRMTADGKDSSTQGR
jgi:hypothetical protein